MSRRKREVKYEGVNDQGNRYTVYDDDAYRYRNVNQETGKTSSTYFDTNKGHRFYSRKGPDGYEFHENANKGFRDYKMNKPVDRGQNAQGNRFESRGNNSYRYGNDSGSFPSNSFNDDRQGNRTVRYGNGSGSFSSNSYNDDRHGTAANHTVGFVGYAVHLPQPEAQVHRHYHYNYKGYN